MILNHGRRLRQIARCDAYQCSHPIFLLIFFQRRPRYEGAGMRRMDRAFLAITVVATVAVVLLLGVSLVL
jgi:hypothetical protein